MHILINIFSIEFSNLENKNFWLKSLFNFFIWFLSMFGFFFSTQNSLIKIENFFFFFMEFLKIKKQKNLERRKFFQKNSSKIFLKQKNLHNIFFIPPWHISTKICKLFISKNLHSLQLFILEFWSLSPVIFFFLFRQFVKAN